MWNWNLETLVFEGRGKLEYPGKNPPVARTRTNNKLNPHTLYDAGTRNQTRATLVEASALTTAPSLEYTAGDWNGTQRTTEGSMAEWFRALDFNSVTRVHILPWPQAGVVSR